MNTDAMSKLLLPGLFLLLGALLAGVVAWTVVGLEPNFARRTIGIAILHGQDPSARTIIHVFSVLAGICIALSCLFLLQPSFKEPVFRTGDASEGAVLAAIVASLLLLYWASAEPVFFQTALGLSALGVVGLFYHYRQFSKDALWAHYSCLALCYQLVITGYAVLGIRPAFDLSLLLIFLPLLAVAFVLVERAYTEESRQIKLQAVLNACWLLSFAPLTVIAANEMQYTLSARGLPLVSVNWVWYAIAAVLVGTVLVRASSAFIKSTVVASDQPSIKTIFLYRHLPLVLLANVVLLEYRDVFEFFALRDFFHGGEEVVPVQQIVQFGAIPYIDYYPPHGLFDALPQLFYQWLNQTAFAEAHVWGQGYMSGWLPRGLVAIFLFWFLGKFLGPLPAFLILFSLPTYQVLHPYYVVLMLPVLGLASAPVQNLMRYGFWLLVLFMLLWRIDFGIAAIAAGSFVLMAKLWQIKSLKAALSALVPAVAVASIGAGVFIVLCLAKDIAPLIVFKKILLYIHVQTPLSAYQEVVKQVDGKAVVQYIVFPVTGVLYVAYFAYRILRGHRLTAQHYVLAYVAVASLVISARSLNRHSHYEGVFNGYLYLILLALVPLVIFRLSTTIRAVYFSLFCVVSFLSYPKTESFFYLMYYQTETEAQLPYPAGSVSILALREQDQPDGRLGNDRHMYQNLVSFLQAFLRDKETFYDFMNAPLLYALSEKPLPSYFMETFFHTSEAIQEDLIGDLSILYAKQQLPLVLFHQDNPWSAIDGVNTEVRSYRVAEFLYEHYQPCVALDTYEIWLDSRLSAKKDCLQFAKDRVENSTWLAGDSEYVLRKASAPQQRFNVRLLPWVWANYDQASGGDHAPYASESRRLNTHERQPDRLWEIELPHDESIQQFNYLDFTILAAQDTTARLKYGRHSSFKFTVVGSERPQAYRLRVSLQYGWYKNESDRARLVFQDDVELIDVQAVRAY